MKRIESGAVASESLTRSPERSNRSGHLVHEDCEHRATQSAACAVGAFIEVKNVWQEYGDQVVLERLNLSINEGEFCTLVAASGCGKSTFLRLLLGQEQPTRGQFLIDSKPLPADQFESFMVGHNAQRW